MNPVWGVSTVLQAKEICEDVKQQLVELAYLSTVTAGVAGLLSMVGCGPCLISAIALAILAGSIHYINAKIQCNDCHVECYHCTSY